MDDLPDNPEEQLDDQTLLALYQATYQDFPTFVDLVFSDSFENFVRGEWLLTRAKFLGENNRTCHVGPRNHWKSTGLYAHWLWQLWRARFNGMEGMDFATGSADLEGHYFSYKEKSAGYHIGEAKDSISALIERNPWFDPLEDCKPTAETKGKWTWDDGDHYQTLSPHGMMSHSRGIHGDVVYVDDPFQDPSGKGGAGQLNPTKVLKINYIFKTTVKGIPTHEDDQLHIVTTPQTEEDFVFNHDLMEEYAHRVDPAIKSHDPPQVIWENWRSYDWLMQEKEEIGPKLFNQEYMCKPMSREIGYFREEELDPLIMPGLQDVGEKTKLQEDWDAAPPRTVEGYVGGMDIGKKRHPSHLALFAVLSREGEERARLLVQVHSKWMDNWDYTRQAEYCQRVIDSFGVKTIKYDNTRGEFESMDEMGDLPSEMDGVSLSGGTNNQIATKFDVYAGAGRLILLPDQRQRRQVLAVSNDLDAVETDEGHGESFWSIGLAVMAADEVHWGPRVKTLET